MNKKISTPNLANDIAFVLSQIITDVGAVLFLYALIRLEIDKSNSNWYYSPNSDLLVMKEYGLAILIAGFVSIITCVFNYSKIESSLDKASPAQQETLSKKSEPQN